MKAPELTLFATNRNSELAKRDQEHKKEIGKIIASHKRVMENISIMNQMILDAYSLIAASKKAG